MYINYRERGISTKPSISRRCRVNSTTCQYSWTRGVIYHLQVILWIHSRLFITFLKDLWICHRIYFITYTSFTPTLRSLCDPCATHKTGQILSEAQRKPTGCLLRSNVAQLMFRHRHGRHSRHKVLNVFKTVGQGSPIGWWLKCRWNEAEEWQTHFRGYRIDGWPIKWLPRNKCALLQTWSLNRTMHLPHPACSAPQLGDQL